MKLHHLLHIISLFPKHGETSIHPKDKLGKSYCIEFTLHENGLINLDLNSQDSGYLHSFLITDIERDEYNSMDEEIEDGVDINSIETEEKKTMIKMVTA